MYKESLGGAKVLHVVANPAFDLDGDRGSGTSYLLYYHCKDGKGAAIDCRLLHRPVRKTRTDGASRAVR